MCFGGSGKNTCGLVSKWEQREGELGIHSTHSTAGAMLACLQVARPRVGGGPLSCDSQVIASAGGRQGSGLCNFLASLKAKRQMR